MASCIAVATRPEPDLPDLNCGDNDEGNTAGNDSGDDDDGWIMATEMMMVLVMVVMVMVMVSSDVSDERAWPW